MTFLAQKLTYTINMLFNFVFGSFFKQNLLLNLVILGIYEKDDVNKHVFQNKTSYSSKPDQ